MDVPTHNQEAEQSLLGAILSRPSILEGVKEIIDAKHFYFPRHQKLYKAMCEMAEEGESIDAVTVSARLSLCSSDRNELLTISQTCLVIDNWRSYAEIVKDSYERRTIVKDAENLIRQVQEGKPLSKLTVPVPNPIERTGTLPIISLADVPEPGPMRYRVKRLIPENYPTLIHAAGGVGKSFLGLYIGCCVAQGRPFIGMNTIKGRVLYVDFELSQEEQGRRIHQIKRGLGLSKIPDGLDYLCPGIQEGVPTKIKKLVSSIASEHYDLYIFDSLGAALQGDMEAAKDIVPFYQAIRSLGTVLLLDHQSKVLGGQKYQDKDPFGSVYKTNLSRSVWQLRQKKPDIGEDLLLSLSHKKTNFGPLHEPIGMRATFGHEFILKPADVPPEKEERDTARDRIIAALAVKPATNKELEDITEYASSTIRKEVSELQKDGYVHEHGKKVKASIWALTPTVPVPSLSSRTGTVVDEGLEITRGTSLAPDYSIPH